MSKHSYSNEKSRAISKLNTDSNSNHAPTISGSAKATSRSITSISRQMLKQQITGGSGGPNTSNRNNANQIILTSQQKTPVGAQMSTGVTTQSQKHLQLNQSANSFVNKPPGTSALTKADS